MYCLCKGFSIFLKDVFKNLHWQSKKKSRTYINFGNDENQAQKSLIPTRKPDSFDYKRYKGKGILKFEFASAINNGNCGVRWSMSICLLRCMDNLLGMNQTQYLIRPIVMIITIIRIKKTLENELLHLYLTP